MATFLVARNPEEETSLPFLLWLPLGGGLVLKARDTWPRLARVYCHPFEGGWPAGAEVVDEAPVVLCRRRGASVDLVLDRPRFARSQFIFTEIKGRPAIFWQTQQAARLSKPGARIPKGKARGTLQVVVDTRERYPYKFSGRDVVLERQALPAGDYGALVGDRLVAVVERKAPDNATSSLSDGTLGFQLPKLAEVGRAAVVVEGEYAGLFKVEQVSGAWLADLLARLQVRYPEVPIVFAGSRKLAEDWTYRFLSAAVEDLEPE